MTKEDLILERLDRIESQMLPIVQTAGSIRELKEDLMPLSSQAIRLVINELEEVESSFQLEDLLVLMKRLLRSTKNITFALEQFENIVDFVQTIEPLLRSSVPQVINYLDDLEQKACFGSYKPCWMCVQRLPPPIQPKTLNRSATGPWPCSGWRKSFPIRRRWRFWTKWRRCPVKSIWPRVKMWDRSGSCRPAQAQMSKRDSVF